MCTCRATTDGLTKIPAPMIPPMTIMVASKGPSRRASDGSEEDAGLVKLSLQSIGVRFARASASFWGAQAASLLRPAACRAGSAIAARESRLDVLFRIAGVAVFAASCRELQAGSLRSPKALIATVCYRLRPGRSQCRRSFRPRSRCKAQEAGWSRSLIQGRLSVGRQQPLPAQPGSDRPASYRSP